MRFLNPRQGLKAVQYRLWICAVGHTVAQQVQRLPEQAPGLISITVPLAMMTTAMVARPERRDR